MDNSNKPTDNSNGLNSPLAVFSGRANSPLKDATFQFSSSANVDIHKPEQAHLIKRKPSCPESEFEDVPLSNDESPSYNSGLPNPSDLPGQMAIDDYKRMSGLSDDGPYLVSSLTGEEFLRYFKDFYPNAYIAIAAVASTSRPGQMVTDIESPVATPECLTKIVPLPKNKVESFFRMTGDEFLQHFKDYYPYFYQLMSAPSYKPGQLFRFMDPERLLNMTRDDIKKLPRIPVFHVEHKCRLCDEFSDELSDKFSDVFLDSFSNKMCACVSRITGESFLKLFERRSS